MNARNNNNNNNADDNNNNSYNIIQKTQVIWVPLGDPSGTVAIADFAAADAPPRAYCRRSVASFRGDSNLFTLSNVYIIMRISKNYNVASISRSRQ